MNSLEKKFYEQRNYDVSFNSDNSPKQKIYFEKVKEFKRDKSPNSKNNLRMNSKDYNIKRNLLNILDCVDQNIQNIDETEINEIRDNTIKLNNKYNMNSKYNLFLNKDQNTLENLNNFNKNNLEIINFENYDEIKNFNSLSPKNNQFTNKIKIEISNSKNDYDFQKSLKIKKNTVFSNKKIFNLNNQNNFRFENNLNCTNRSLSESFQLSTLKNNNESRIENIEENNNFSIEKSSKKLNFNNKIISKLKKEDTIEGMLEYIFNNKNQKNKFDKNNILNNKDNTSKVKSPKKINSCTCKKTNCSKYYCLCRRNGLICGIHCSCEGCLNDSKEVVSKKIIKLVDIKN